jgi:hypothetical protein
MWDVGRQQATKHPTVIADFEVKELVHDDVVLEGAGLAN